MLETNSFAEIKHYLMLNALLDRLKKNGIFEIEADHLRHTCRPHPIHGPDGETYVPDMVACRDGQRYFFEVKTDEELFSSDTEDQLRAISEYAAAVGGEFYLVVPRGTTAKAEFLLEWLDLPEVKILYC